MSFVSRGGGGVGGTVLGQRPVDEPENLALLLYEALLGPAGVPEERPGKPGLVVTLDHGVGIKGSPAIDGALVAGALHQERPEVALLTILVGIRTMSVAKERPDVIFTDITWGGVAGVERKHAQIFIGPGSGEILRRFVDERPEIELAVIVAGATPAAEKRPKLEAVVPFAVNEA